MSNHRERAYLNQCISDKIVDNAMEFIGEPLNKKTKREMKKMFNYKDQEITMDGASRGVTHVIHGTKSHDEIQLNICAQSMK